VAPSAASLADLKVARTNRTLPNCIVFEMFREDRSSCCSGTIQHTGSGLKQHQRAGLSADRSPCTAESARTPSIRPRISCRRRAFRKIGAYAQSLRWPHSPQSTVGPSTIRPIHVRDVPTSDSTGWRPCVVLLVDELGFPPVANQNLASLSVLGCAFVNGFQQTRSPVV
jgi:hypothetical protein